MTLYCPRCGIQTYPKGKHTLHPQLAVKRPKAGRPPIYFTPFSCWMMRRGLTTPDIHKAIGCGAKSPARWRRGRPIRKSIAFKLRLLWPDCPLGTITKPAAAARLPRIRHSI